MDNKLNGVQQGTGLLEKFVALVDKYGVKKILIGLGVMIFAGYIMFFALNPSYILKKYEQYVTDLHNKQLTERMYVVEKLNAEIEKIKMKVDADRVFIIEFHNSVKSIEGFPFAFGSMNFETCDDGIHYVSDEYTNFNLSKYKLVPYIYKNNIFMGDVEDIKDIDNRLYLKFLSNDVKKIYLIKIEGLNMPTGILGVTYCEDKGINDQHIMSILRQEVIKTGYIMSNSY